uniref:Reverse transcriptase domain-containing protein n=1 Tax=Panagrolaimus superbus TaxID=310955 RepID=A0A914Z9B1_9BILA
MNIHIRSCNVRDKEEVKRYNNKGPIPKADKVRRISNAVTSQPIPPTSSLTSPASQRSSESPPRQRQNPREPLPVTSYPVSERTRSKSRSRSTSISTSIPSSRQPSREPSIEIVESSTTTSQLTGTQPPSLQPIIEEQDLSFTSPTSSPTSSPASEHRPPTLQPFFDVQSVTTSPSTASPALVYHDFDEIDAWVTTEAAISLHSNMLSTEDTPPFNQHAPAYNPDGISIPELDSFNDSTNVTSETAAEPVPATQPVNLDQHNTNASDPWEKRFADCQDSTEFETLYDQFTIFLQTNSKSSSQPTSQNKNAPASTSQNPQQQMPSTEHQQQQRQPNHHHRQQESRSNQQKKHQNQSKEQKKRNDTKAAKKIQALYRLNKKKAFTQITTAGPSQHCQVDAEIVSEHFKNIYAPSDRQPTPPPIEVPPLDPIEGETDPLSKAFTIAEVQERIKNSKNTAPGPDLINYNMLKKKDPTGITLTSIFNTVLRLKHIPEDWNRSSTILIHKKGDPDQLSNWRPIALSNCISKLFASVLAHRLTSWAMSNNRLSKSQKGFLPFEGCLEHNFELQSIIQHAKRTKTTALIAWLDLENAFGSAPHSTIFQSLELAGLHSNSIDLIKLLYANCTTTIRCSTGPTDPIAIKSGVKQGCPLSPIVFNFAIDAVIRAIEHLNLGINLHGKQHSVKGYADDLATIARSAPALEQQMKVASTVSTWSGFKFNAKKCATLHIDGKKHQALRSKFRIQNQAMEVLNEDQSYEHLGVPTGYKLHPSATETIKAMTNQVNKIDASLLAPWQKFDAINTFVVSQLSFHLKGGMVPKKPLNDLDKLIKRLGKKWLSLPQQASPEILYLPYQRGGMNLLPTSLLADVSQVAHAYRLLTSNDHSTRKLAKDSMKEVVEKRLRRSATLKEICQYYNGEYENFPNDSNDYQSTWTRLRAATRRLSHKINIEWKEDSENNVVLVINKVVANRKIVEIQLKDAVRNHFLETLIKKPDQGKVYEVVSKSNYSNHFMHDGNFTRFAEWRFVHRARLGVVPLNGCRRYGNDNNKQCRRCGGPNETLPHVLNHCQPHMPTIRKRHDAIQNRLIKATKLQPNQKLLNDICVPGVVSNLRPDITILDNVNKTATIIDIACPFENRQTAIDAARNEKLSKYQHIKEQLQQKGYKVFLDAFVIGSLGSYDQNNWKCLVELGINRNYAHLMKKLMVSDTIKWSRNIYIEHVTGQRQY